MGYGKKSRPLHQSRFDFKGSSYGFVQKPPFWRVDTQAMTSTGKTLSAMFTKHDNAENFASKYKGSEVLPATADENQQFLEKELPTVLKDTDYKGKSTFTEFSLPYKRNPLQAALDYANDEGGVVFSEVKVHASYGSEPTYLYVKQAVPLGRAVHVVDPVMDVTVGGVRSKIWEGQATGVYVVITEEWPTIWSDSASQRGFSVRDENGKWA